MENLKFFSKVRKCKFKPVKKKTFMAQVLTIEIKLTVYLLLGISWSVFKKTRLEKK
jgi:hypothetical protein